MNRPRSALALAVLAAVALAGCGNREASQRDVQDKVEELLTNEDDRPADQLYPGAPFSATDAAGAAACVAQGLFDPARFSKDQRNDITQALDGDLPSSQVIADFEALVEGCVDEVTAPSAEGPSADDEGDDGDDRGAGRRTTERQSSDDDEE